MKFNCGPSLEQRFDRWLKARQQWHQWYAWHPVRLTDTERCVWLEPVWCRVHDGCGYYSTWKEYAVTPPVSGGK